MRLPVLIALAFTATAFAGCLAGVGTITAKEGLGEARDAAVDFVGGGSPLLIGVMSIEPMNHYIEDDFEVRIHLDSSPGDGIAPGWMYEFLVGDQYVVIGYSSGLGVLFEARENLDEGGEDLDEYADYEISNWKIDSDEAAKALNAHENWPEPSDSTNVIWELRQGEECPYWMVDMYTELDSGDYYHAVVNACTGEVESIEHVEFVIEFYSVSDSGQAYYPVESLDLEIEVGGDRELFVFLDYSCFGVDAPIVEEITATVYHEGEAFEERPVPCSGGTNGYGTGGLGEGTYSVSFSGTGVGQIVASLEATWAV